MGGKGGCDWFSFLLLSSMGFGIMKKIVFKLACLCLSPASALERQAKELGSELGTTV